MKHNRYWTFCAASLLACAATLSAHEMGIEKGHGDVTMQGEVVDMACYMSHEVKGPKHKDCAAMCIKGGMPIGLLTDQGTVYLLVEDHTNKDAYQSLKELAGQQVKIMGDLRKRGGTEAIVVEKAQKAG